MNAISSSMSPMQFSVEYSMSVTKKVIDTQQLAGQEMAAMLEKLAAPELGALLDTRA